MTPGQQVQGGPAEDLVRAGRHEDVARAQPRLPGPGPHLHKVDIVSSAKNISYLKNYPLHPDVVLVPLGGPEGVPPVGRHRPVLRVRHHVLGLVELVRYLSFASFAKR